jgi:PAS domain S-box-containing protein
MKDENKTKKQLINEIVELRQRISEFKNSEIELKQADEMLLRESEERYKAIIEQSADCIYLANTESRQILHANQAFQRLLGYNADDITKLTIYDFVDHGREDIDDKINHLLKGQNYFLGERRYRGKDGTFLDVEVSVSLISYSGRNALCGIARDITERKRAEESLRLNESRLEALLKLNHMPDASFKEVSDFALEEAIRLTGSKIGYLAFMNDDETVLTMYSWSKSALEECRIADKPLIYPVETTGLWGEAVRQRKPIITNDYTAPNPWKKGYPKDHVEVIRHMNVPIFDGDHIVIVAGVGNKLSDYDTSDVRQLTLLMEGMWRIIQRKLTKESLRKERDKAQKYLDIAGVILVAIDAEQKVTLINKRGTELLGYPEQEVIDKNWFDNFVAERDRNSVKAVFAKLMAGEIKPVEYFENSVLTKSGEEKIIAWRNTLLKDESGNIVGTLSSGEDVTEHRQARKEMTFLASIVEHIPDAICSMDLNGNIVSWNEGAEKMLGYMTEEILGRPFAITVPNELARKELDHCISTLNVEGFFTGHESLRLAKDGKIVPVEITAVALKDKEQNITNYTSIMRDISKRKTAQEESKKRVKELEEFYYMAVGRELRMKELKEEMEDLKEEIERLKEELKKYKNV